MAVPSVSTTYDQTIAGRGLRMTDQRRAVYGAIMGKGKHPTAVEVFMQVKGTMPSISLATVYNCLETLVDCGLVRHVHHERESSRYCANLEEHAHLFCEACGSVTDLPLTSRRRVEELCELPTASVITSREVSFRGFCPDCAQRAAGAPKIFGPRNTRNTLKGGTEGAALGDSVFTVDSRDRRLQSAGEDRAKISKKKHS